MLFDKIDEEITKSNVNYLLSRYHSIKRLAGASTPKVTASYSIMPRSNTGLTSDSTGDFVENKIKSTKMLDEVHRAFNCLSGKSKQRLYFKYIAEDRRYDYEIFEDLNISKDTYYRELGKAQIEFAEAYKSGELIAFEIEP